MVLLGYQNNTTVDCTAFTNSGYWTMRTCYTCIVIHQAIAVQSQLCAPYSRSNAVVVAGAEPGIWVVSAWSFHTIHFWPTGYASSSVPRISLRIHHNCGLHCSHEFRLLDYVYLLHMYRDSPSHCSTIPVVCSVTWGVR